MQELYIYVSMCGTLAMPKGREMSQWKPCWFFHAHHLVYAVLRAFQSLSPVWGQKTCTASYSSNIPGDCFIVLSVFTFIYMYATFRNVDFVTHYIDTLHWGVSMPGRRGGAVHKHTHVPFFLDVQDFLVWMWNVGWASLRALCILCAIQMCVIVLYKKHVFHIPSCIAQSYAMLFVYVEIKRFTIDHSCYSSSDSMLSVEWKNSHKLFLFYLQRKYQIDIQCNIPWHRDEKGKVFRR